MTKNSNYSKEIFILFPDVTLCIRTKRCGGKIDTIKATGGKVTFKIV